MSVKTCPGCRFCDMTHEEQDILSAMKQSQICLEHWELTENEREFHRNIIAHCAHELRMLWYPQ